jgi:hypothetical protein
VFTRTRGDAKLARLTSEIVSVRSADGFDRRVLVENRIRSGFPGANQPEYAPDGRRIVFFAVVHGLSPPGIYTMRPNGSHKRLLRSLSPLTFDVVDLDYSPNGRQIVFQRLVPRWGIVGMEMMRSNGSHRKPVPCSDLDGVAYSPRGGSFVAGDEGFIRWFDRRAVGPFGCGGIPATTGPGYASNPSWQPLPGG